MEVQTGTKMDKWTPEDPVFWEKQGRSIAYRTLVITTLALVLSFATWFVWSAAVVHLNSIGFNLSVSQGFWLAAMPGLSGATLRLIHSFLILRFGTRTVVTLSTASMVIPSIGLGMAVQDPTTPFWLLLVLAALAGLGGGNFASFMSSTSLFFPKVKQGTALGVQAGIGNFGVSLVQFAIPIFVTMSMFGGLGGEPQAWVAGEVTKSMWLQNAGYIWVIPVVLSTVLCWFGLVNLPIRRPIRKQFVIFKRKHTWVMFLLYVMSFGSFSGFSASFPLLIREVFGHLPNAPEPLAYAFLGPLIGSIIRPPAGWLADKVGGGLVTLVCSILLIVGVVGVTASTSPQTAADFTPFLIWMLVLFFASGIGNGSTFQQIPFIFPPEEAGPVLGFTSIAAYGAFIFPVLFGWALSSFGSPNMAFYIFFAFYLVCAVLNWSYYTKAGCEKPCKPVPAPSTVRQMAGGR
ncbi:MAG: NarK/NasA family nitrate transporter [Chloroflexi bacterium]|nr:NarK/NasA family nitrate transporter [Chloroflexota bacterium]